MASLDPTTLLTIAQHLAKYEETVVDLEKRLAQPGGFLEIYNLLLLIGVFQDAQRSLDLAPATGPQFRASKKHRTTCVYEGCDFPRTDLQAYRYHQERFHMGRKPGKF